MKTLSKRWKEVMESDPDINPPKSHYKGFLYNIRKNAGMAVTGTVAGLTFAAVIGNTLVDRKAEAVYIQNGEFETQTAPWKASYFSQQMSKKRIPVHRVHAYRVYLEEGESIEKDVAPYVQNELRRTLHLNLDIGTVKKVIEDFTKAKKESTTIEAEISRAIEASGKIDKADKERIREQITKGNYAWIPCPDQFQTGHSLYLQEQIEGQKKNLKDYKSEASSLMLQIQAGISENKAAADVNFEKVYNQLDQLKGVLEVIRENYVTHGELDAQIYSIKAALALLELKDMLTEDDLKQLRQDFTKMSKDYGARLDELQRLMDNLYYPEDKFPLEFEDPAPGEDTSWIGEDFQITPYPLAKGEVVKEGKYVTAFLSDKKDSNPFKPDMGSAKIPDTAEGGTIKRNIYEEWKRELSFNGLPKTIKKVVANVSGLGLVTLGLVVFGPGKNVTSIYGEGFKKPGRGGEITYKIRARSPESQIHAGAGVGGVGGPGGGAAGGGATGGGS